MQASTASGSYSLARFFEISCSLLSCLLAADGLKQGVSYLHRGPCTIWRSPMLAKEGAVEVVVL